MTSTIGHNSQYPYSVSIPNSWIIVDFFSFLTFVVKDLCPHHDVNNRLHTWKNEQGNRGLRGVHEETIKAYVGNQTIWRNILKD